MNALLYKLLAGMILFFSCASVNCIEKVYSCTDANGKIRFADNKEKCNANIVELSYQKHRDVRTNYRYPLRSYVKQESVYNIYIESPESNVDVVAFKTATRKLNATLNKIFSILPVASQTCLKEIDFYIMIGDRAKLGGENNILRYHPKVTDSTYSLHDKRWSHAIVIYDVDNFISLTKLWLHKTLTHELAHAWHIKDWSANYQKSKDAWLASRNASLYLSQRDLYGRLLKPAYASTNEVEYFADLSVMYFVDNDYYPFNRSELKAYDPVGFKLIESMWNIKDHKD